MGSVEYQNISEVFGNKGEALAMLAAPGAQYIGYEESVEAEYDDDSGYYLTTTAFYSGLFDAKRHPLPIVDQKAYAALTALHGADEDGVDEREHVNAYEMVTRGGYADDTALQLMYQDGDLLSACAEVPDIIDDAVRLVISHADSELLQEMIEELELSPQAIDQVLKSTSDLAAALLDQPRLRSSHLATIYTIYENTSTDETEEIWDQIAAHRRCPTPVLEQLSQVSESAQRSVPREEELRDVAHDPEANDPVGDLVFVAGDIATPDETLDYLARSPEVEVRWTLAERDRVPDSLLVTLATDADLRVRKAAFSHPLVGEATLRVLATHEHADIRAAVAAHALVPQDVLVQLADDTWSVFRVAAAHPNAPADLSGVDASVQGWISWQLRGTQKPEQVMESLLESPDKEVRRALSQHPQTPASLLEWLAADKDSLVRLNVARHPSTPPVVRQNLLEDTELDIHFASDPHVPEAVLRRAAQKYRNHAAKNPSLPRDLLVQLAQIQEYSTINGAFDNTAMTADVLELLLNSPDDDVRRRIVQHRAVTSELLTRLATDIERHIRQRVAKHPLASAEALTMLAEDPDSRVRAEVAEHPNATPAVLARLVNDDDRRVRWRISRCQKLTVEQLAILAKDEKAEVREAVALNGGVTSNILMQLARDEDKDVAGTATRMLERLNSAKS